MVPRGVKFSSSISPLHPSFFSPPLSPSPFIILLSLPSSFLPFLPSPLLSSPSSASVRKGILAVMMERWLKDYLKQIVSLQELCPGAGKGAWAGDGPVRWEARRGGGCHMEPLWAQATGEEGSTTLLMFLPLSSSAWISHSPSLRRSSGLESRRRCCLMRVCSYASEGGMPGLAGKETGRGSCQSAGISQGPGRTIVGPGTYLLQHAHTFYSTYIGVYFKLTYTQNG